LEYGYPEEVIFVNTYEPVPQTGESGGTGGGSGSAAISPLQTPAGPGGADGDSAGGEDDADKTPRLTVEKLFTGDHIWYIRGYDDNTIRPDTPITRAEVSMAFFRLLSPDMQPAAPEAKFGDVKAGDWYGLAIDTLAYHGILNGYRDGSFKPDKPITRAELATVISRFEHLDKTGDNPYDDLNNTHWAYEYILSATSKGWFVGDSLGRFRPDDDITRAEFVTVANRVLKRQILTADIPDDVHAFDDFNSGHWSYAAFIEAVYTHEYALKPDGVNEIWTQIIGDGIHAAYNR
jgi:hypothetical protein